MKRENCYRRQLSSGELRVFYHGEENELHALFDIAERRNPKRAFLFVSHVLCRHIPVAPTTMRAVYQRLANSFPDGVAGPVLFVGMAETAVGLGAGVFDELRERVDQPIYLTSTRHPQQADLLCEFKEAHSHATDHLIYLPHDGEMRRRVLEAKTLVLIDDEATTGNTFINLLAALHPHLAHLQQAISVTLTDWSGDAFAGRCHLPVRQIALIKGRWEWHQRDNATVPEMPAVNITACGEYALSQRQTWGRLGMIRPAADLGSELTADAGETILVLGSGEFVWEPFLLAERLEQQGADVKFSAASRSPIAPGMAIQSLLSFNDNYGLGIPNFAYNIAHQRFDRIILCVETPKNSVDPNLVHALESLCTRLEILSYE